jgi:murein hydrolase activator
MRNKAFVIVIAWASVVHADTYNNLIQRYEVEIKKQERQLRSVRKNLMEKEQEAKRWQRRAESAKSQWNETGESVERARRMVRQHQERRTKTQALAEAAQWTVLEHAALSNQADAEMAYWTTELYKRQQTPNYFEDLTPAAQGSATMVGELAALSRTTHLRAAEGQREETALRMEEFRWRNEEQKQSQALDRFRQQQQNLWLRWQEALQRRKTLEAERSQLEQSAQAMRVMLTELRGQRTQTQSVRSEITPSAPRRTAAFRHLKGALPWPVAGRVTQNFGKQYSDKLQQLIVSNGIRVETESGKPVRSIQAGKVLFARPFQQYGQLVIIRHQHGLTSVYGELGQTQVKEGDLVSTLDAVGTIGEGRSFYFELRHDEEPINPLVWLAPASSAQPNRSAARPDTQSEVSSRRKY